MSDLTSHAARGRLGAQKRNSIEHHVAKVVERAGELTPELREQLAAILRPSGEAEQASA